MRAVTYILVGHALTGCPRHYGSFVTGTSLGASLFPTSAMRLLFKYIWLLLREPYCRLTPFYIAISTHTIWQAVTCLSLSEHGLNPNPNPYTYLLTYLTLLLAMWRGISGLELKSCHTWVGGGAAIAEREKRERRSRSLDKQRR